MSEKPDVPEQGREAFLGDGLYVSFDGWQIWLRAPFGDDSDHRIAMEPEVYRALRRWVRTYAGLKTHMGET
jgi:hypothetical protein